MRLHLSGVKLPKYGSLQDRIMRGHLTRESEKELKKTQLLALLVANSVDFADQGAASNWDNKIKELWNRYLALELGIELSPVKEKEVKMLEFYEGFVKKLKPTLSNNKGSLVVTGLDNLVKLSEYQKKQKG